jgi:hypothetical protein
MAENIEYYEVETYLEASQRSSAAIPKRNLFGNPLLWPVVGLVAGGLAGLAVYLVTLTLAFDASGVFALGAFAPLCIPVGASFGLAVVTMRKMRWGR